jgi:hypothetical protein
MPGGVGGRRPKPPPTRLALYNTRNIRNRKMKLLNKIIFKQLPVWIIILHAVITTLQAQSPVQVAEDQRFQAMVSRDTISLHKLIHKDLIYVHSNALQESKTDFIHSVSSGKIQYQSMQRDKIAITQWRKTAIVNGEVAVKGINNTTPFDVKLRYLAVYRKKSGKWVLYRWQSTRIPT